MAGCYSEVTWNGLGILFEKHSVWRNGDPKGTDKQMYSFEAILCQVKKCNYNWSPSKEKWIFNTLPSIPIGHSQHC